MRYVPAVLVCSYTSKKVYMTDTLKEAKKKLDKDIEENPFSYDESINN